jgi:hypothetical protein
MQRYPLEARRSICESHASAFNGQPWLKRTGGPLPQSLKKICVPSLVAMVPPMVSPRFGCDAARGGEATMRRFSTGRVSVAAIAAKMDVMIPSDAAFFDALADCLGSGDSLFEALAKIESAKGAAEAWA